MLAQCARVGRLYLRVTSVIARDLVGLAGLRVLMILLAARSGLSGLNDHVDLLCVHQFRLIFTQSSLCVYAP